ncbi:hypothetical protein AGMMS49992_03210 [Clostridia bacterium]|nr:hypothetical protein AGMMS49992_03210 [Clostridia bacterium]
MNIIIAGDGKAGYTLAERLSQDADNRITIIDTDLDALSATAEAIDVRVVNGSAVDIHTLKDAGIVRADLFIATTDSDERNMLACLIAKNSARPTPSREPANRVTTKAWR